MSDNKYDKPKQQFTHYPAELKLRVTRGAFLVRIRAVFILLFGLVFLFVGLYLVWHVFILDDSTSEQLSYGAVSTLAIGLAAISYAIALFKAASGFEAFEPWAYRWVEILTLRRVGPSLFFPDIYAKDLRAAFKQPEFEYRDQPEYGPKLEEPTDTEANKHTHSKPS